MLIIDNKKLHDWVQEKDVLVNSGRKISRDIEMLDIKIKRFENKEKLITGKVIPLKELTDKGEAIIKQITDLNEELEKISKQISDSKLEAIPKEMKDSHMKLLKEKEICERERNKIALKVQKFKDRIVPLVQREVKPLLRAKRLKEVDMGRFDDIETAQVKDGKVVISTFNHLEGFMEKFR